MEIYVWENNASKTNIETLFEKPSQEIPTIDEYSTAVNNLMNEGIVHFYYCFQNKFVKFNFR